MRDHKDELRLMALESEVIRLGQLLDQRTSSLTEAQHRVKQLETAMREITGIPKKHAYICGDCDGKCYWNHAEAAAKAALNEEA